ncbi:hypothetical protein FM103_19000 [Corynebacterium xerosis]|nr:hypothetical protein FM103_19000 [Corynebacterium xerosis]
MSTRRIADDTTQPWPASHGEQGSEGPVPRHGPHADRRRDVPASLPTSAPTSVPIPQKHPTSDTNRRKTAPQPLLTPSQTPPAPIPQKRPTSDTNRGKTAPQPLLASQHAFPSTDSSAPIPQKRPTSDTNRGIRGVRDVRAPI